jgi:hypothetical protein
MYYMMYIVRQTGCLDVSLSKPSLRGQSDNVFQTYTNVHMFAQLIPENTFVTGFVVSCMCTKFCTKEQLSVFYTQVEIFFPGIHNFVSWLKKCAPLEHLYYKTPYSGITYLRSRKPDLFLPVDQKQDKTYPCTLVCRCIKKDH